jgi:hypothetical protein
LLLYRGDTYEWQFTLWTDAGKTQPADLTGVEVKAEVRVVPGGALLTTLACSVTLPNIITATLAAAACATLPATGAWDMQLTYPDGHVATVLAGAVTVAPDVTDSATGATRSSTLALRAARMRA